MKKFLFMSFFMTFLSFGNLFAAEDVTIAPDAVERALMGLQTESENKTLAELFDKDLFVKMISRRGSIRLRVLMPACKYVFNNQDVEVKRTYVVDSGVVRDVDVSEFCSQFVKNIVRHHNAVVAERRSEFFYGVYPTTKYHTSEDGMYYTSKVDVSHINIGDITADLQYNRLNNIFAVFKSADNSVVCVFPENSFESCRSEDGLLFESDHYGLFYYSPDEVQQDARLVDLYQRAPVGLNSYQLRVNKYLKPLEQTGTGKAEVAVGLY